MTMPRPAPRILALDPGTRKMGAALLDGGRLQYHEVKVFPDKRNPERQLHEARAAVIQMLKDFRPDVLAMERTFVTANRRMALLHVLFDEIVATAQRRRMRVITFAPATVKKHVTGDGHASKGVVAIAVTQRFPQLSVYLSQDRKWKARHHANMFDAVAVGLTARDRL